MDFWKVFQAITLSHPTNIAFVNIALNLILGVQMFQTLRCLSQSLSFTLMSMDMWKVFQYITLTHLTDFALVNIALNLFPGGPDIPDPQVPLPVTQLHPDVHGHLEGVPDYHSYPSQ